METEKSKHHPVVEIVTNVDKDVERVGLANSGFKALAGTQAFRGYSVLNRSYAMNESGNLRGMVRSARWRVTFNYSSEVGKYLENIGTIASFAANIAEMGHEFEAIWKSQESPSLKGMRYAAAAGTAAERTLLGVVSTGTHLIYASLQRVCQAVGLAGGEFQSGANECVNVLKGADTMVQKSFSIVTDTNNQATFFWWIVDLKFIPRSAQIPSGSHGKGGNVRPGHAIGIRG
jgi:hypothetical protein